jgi:WD40 repeat protein
MTAKRILVGCVLLAALLAAPPHGLAQPPRLDADGKALPPAALARLGSTRFLHRAPVVFLGFTGPQHLLSASRDGDVRLWHLPSGKQVWRSVPPDNSELTPAQITLSRDGKRLALHQDEDWVIRETTAGKELRRFSAKQLQDEGKLVYLDNVHVQLSPDGQFLIALEQASPRTTSRFAIWKVATGTLVRAQALAKGINLRDLALADDGNTLATLGNAEGGESYQLYLWDLAAGKITRTSFLPEQEWYYSLQFLPGGTTLAAVNWNNRGRSAVLLDGATGKTVRRFPRRDDPDDRLNAVMLAAGGKHLLGVGARRVQLWDVATGKELRNVPIIPPDSATAAAALAPDGNTVAVAAHLGFRVWEVGSGKEMVLHTGHHDRVTAVAFSATGGQLATAAPNSSVLLWDVQSSRPLREFLLTPAPKALNTRRQVLAAVERWSYAAAGAEQQVRLAFAPDGKAVLALPPSGRLHCWDAATGQPGPWTGPARELLGFAFAPGGSQLALAGEDGALVLAAWPSGKIAWKRTWVEGVQPRQENDGMLRGDTGTLVTGFVACSPDEKTLLAAGVKTTQKHSTLVCRGLERVTGLVRVQFGAQAAALRLEQAPETVAELDVAVLGLVVSPDGRTAGTLSPAGVRLWDLHTGKELRVMSGRDVVPETAVFSPDGKWLLAGRLDGGLRFWEVATGTLLGDLPAHAAAVTALAFAPDGKRLASGSADTTTLLWDWAQLRQQVRAEKPRQGGAGAAGHRLTAEAAASAQRLQQRADLP